MFAAAGGLQGTPALPNIGTELKGAWLSTIAWLAAMTADQKSCQTHVHTPLNHNSLMLQVYGCQPLEQILTLVSRGLFQHKVFYSSHILSAGFS